MKKALNGHVRLSVRLASALNETLNMLIHAKFPYILPINQARVMTII